MSGDKRASGINRSQPNSRQSALGTKEACIPDILRQPTHPS